MKGLRPMEVVCKLYKSACPSCRIAKPRPHCKRNSPTPHTENKQQFPLSRQTPTFPGTISIGCRPITGITREIHFQL